MASFLNAPSYTPPSFLRPHYGTMNNNFATRPMFLACESGESPRVDSAETDSQLLQLQDKSCSIVTHDNRIESSTVKDSFLHQQSLSHPDNQQAYTRMPPTDKDDSRSSMTPIMPPNINKKPIPPHLRPRMPWPIPKKNESTPQDIAEKLSKIGVTVSAPKPLTKAWASPPAQELAQPSVWGRSNPRSQIALNAAVAGGEASDEPDQGDWTCSSKAKSASPESDQPVVTGRAKRTRGGRGRGCGTARGSRGGWATRKDFPKVDPKRWTTKWDGSGPSTDASPPGSEWASAIERGANNLAVWDGKMNAAPLDWDSRPAFKPGQSEELINKWLRDVDAVCGDSSQSISLDDVEIHGTRYSFSMPKKLSNDLRREQMGDFALGCWRPTTFGRQSCGEIWKKLITSKAPRPVDEGDLEGVVPWWETYVPGTGFLQNYPAPRITGIDPTEENEDEKLKRENDMGSATHAENRQNFERAKIAARKERKKKVQEKEANLRLKPVNGSRAGQSNVAPKTKPSTKVHIRAATSSDKDQICKIYNHYIDNTCAVPETTRVTADEMEVQRKKIQHSGLPYLVAYEPARTIKGRKKKGLVYDEDIVIPDTIRGFAYARDYNNSSSMHKHTAVIELFVDKDFYMKGFATSLFDKLMSMLDPEYLERVVYETNDELIGAASGRNIKNILVNLRYDDAKRVDWIASWVERWMGFVQVGEIHEIGTKLGKPVGLIILQRQTGLAFDHANPPPLMKIEDNASLAKNAWN